MSFASLLNSSVTLERPTNTQDSSGGITKSWLSITTTPASVQPLSTKERMLFAQRQIMVTHRIYTAINLQPQKGDRVTVPSTGQTFVIIGFMNQAGRNSVWSIDAKEQT